MIKDGQDLHDRRLRAGLTQRQLAVRAGMSQPAVAAYESGSRRLTPEASTRLGAALRVRPSVLLKNSRAHLRQILRSHGITEARVFGSVARGEDSEESDLDLLVAVPSDFDIFDKALLVDELAEALGAPVDVVPDRARGPVVAKARAEAVPL